MRFLQMSLTGAWVTVTITGAAILIFLTPEELPQRLQLGVTGFTNNQGTLNLVVQFPKALPQPARLPFGHKGWSRSTVEITCRLADGTVTNVISEHEGGYGSTLRTNGPHLDVARHCEIPATAQMVRVTKAETVLGSFQDIEIPFIITSLRTVFVYELPDRIFSITAPD